MSSDRAKYDFAAAEKKWREAWLKEGVYEPSLREAEKPFYNLMMFPYPSAEGLHVGNMYAFTGADVYGRYMRMQGHDVFEPIGLDGFGIHSENYALKVGTHPAEQAKISEKRFYEQLAAIGNGFAWKERLETYDPAYYKWTQWIFVKLFKAGLAYRKKQAVNWCPSCKTVLADEQVEAGKCERCGTVVVKKDLEQWFFRITKYAERLLQNLDRLDWTEKVKLAQRNWIGRSEGLEIEYPLDMQIYSGDVALASGNPSKLDRLQRLIRFAGLDIRLKLPVELGIKDFDVVEDKTTLAANAEKKARALARLTDLPVLAEDSGLFIDDEKVDPVKVKRNALEGLEEKDLTPEQVAEKMLEYYKNVASSRGGSVDGEWRNALCLVTPDGSVSHAEGSRPVTLTDQPRGQADPYFPLRPIYISRDTGKYVLEQTPEEELIELTPITTVLERLFRPSVRVFTTRPDTNFGATFIALAPEHELVDKMLDGKVPVTPEIRRAIEDYRADLISRSEIERTAEDREKTGIFTGLYCRHRLTDRKLPVYVADFVLSGFGSAAVVGVPGHDSRDFEFAQKFNLPILRVVRDPDGESGEIKNVSQVQSDAGQMMNSGFLDGMEVYDAIERIKDHFESKGWGLRVIQYRLRDWLISRQRYWGPPIPMIFCEACAAAGKGEQIDMPGWYAVPEESLPVELPLIEDFRPRGTGQSPLAADRSFYETGCPACKGPARRETDVSDTFLDSAWYYLRYPSAGKKDEPWSPELIKKWFPVDMYIGGAEHSVLHLLYVRFLALALHDMNLLEFPEKKDTPEGEPFPVFRAHGLIIKEGAKMSKSKGNIVNPDEYIRKFGADVLRMYLMFLAPFEQGGDFRDQAVTGIARFVDRAWRLVSIGAEKPATSDESKLLHQTIKKVGGDIKDLRYNTAISALMILLNHIEKQGSADRDTKEVFVKLLAPLAPYLAEELWREVLGHRSSVHREPWPSYDAEQAAEDTVKLVIQVNGKTRGAVETTVDLPESRALELALEDEKVQAALRGREPVRVVYVPGRIINIVI